MTPQALRQVTVDAEKRGDTLCCATSTMLRLLDVIEAAREALRTQDAYLAVSIERGPDDPEWQTRSREQLDAERALRVALEALDRVEG